MHFAGIAKGFEGWGYSLASNPVSNHPKTSIPMVGNPFPFPDPIFDVGQKTDIFHFHYTSLLYPFLFLPCHSAMDVDANHLGDCSNFPELHSKESGDFWTFDTPPFIAWWG